MKLLIVVDIGCIECGEPSDIIGVFAEGQDVQAETARKEAEDKQKINWSGQHSFETFCVEFNQ